MDDAQTLANGESSRLDAQCTSRFATFEECPLCGSVLGAEHAHFRCGSCGWRDSCCD
ncbi:MAG: hypothetical protein ABR963_04590 [Acidimicrobiales bacterium]